MSTTRTTTRTETDGRGQQNFQPGLDATVSNPEFPGPGRIVHEFNQNGRPLTRGRMRANPDLPPLPPAYPLPVSVGRGRAGQEGFQSRAGLPQFKYMGYRPLGNPPGYAGSPRGTAHPSVPNHGGGFTTINTHHSSQRLGLLGSPLSPLPSTVPSVQYMGSRHQSVIEVLDELDGMDTGNHNPVSTPRPDSESSRHTPRGRGPIFDGRYHPDPHLYSDEEGELERISVGISPTPSIMGSEVRRQRQQDKRPARSYLPSPNDSLGLHDITSNFIRQLMNTGIVYRNMVPGVSARQALVNAFENIVNQNRVSESPTPSNDKETAVTQVIQHLRPGVQWDLTPL